MQICNKSKFKLPPADTNQPWYHCIPPWKPMMSGGLWATSAEQPHFLWLHIIIIVRFKNFNHFLPYSSFTSSGCLICYTSNEIKFHFIFSDRQKILDLCLTRNYRNLQTHLVVEAWAMMFPPMGFLGSAANIAAPSTCATTWFVITTATPNWPEKLLFFLNERSFYIVLWTNKSIIFIKNCKQ